jgi:predicted DsbA family dithiol-disulfide isomerase
VKIEIFSDVACPWCYIGKRRLESALESFDHRDEVEIVWRSFELAPEMPAVSPLTSEQYLTSVKGIPRAKARELINQCSQIGAGEGLDLNFDILKLFNTRSAHQLLHFAKTAGLQGALKERLFHAAFSEGRELGKFDVLVELAAEVGLDPVAARAALESEEFLPSVLDDEEEAHASTVRGVPYFVINNKYALSGAQSTAVFRNAIATIWQEDHPLQMLADSEGTVCGPDGCAV